MAVGGVGNSAAMYIQQSNQSNARGNQLDLARMQNQSNSLKKVVEQNFALQAKHSETVNTIKEAALDAQQGRIDTWA
ncbi:MAG: hypothetical protein KAX55_16775 [Propionivibrio sp.]|nr:hypothetical protein [Propionivibrio sp.]